MKLKELLIENTILLEGFRDILRKFISAKAFSKSSTV